MRKIPISSMDKILEEAGAERISESAKKELNELVEKKAIEVSRQAIKLSKHAKRNTIMKEDIELVLDK
jgi:histone H3/H4